MRSIADALTRAGERARAAGAGTLPAIQIGDEMFDGPDALDRALTRLAVDPARVG
jgi:hypothetical protein